MNKNAPFMRRLAWAWQGIRTAYNDENSFRSQIWVAIATLLALMVLAPGWLWSAVVIMLMGLVLMAELFNTALEAMLDGLHPGENDFVRKAKDCAAGAVLITSLAAVGGGLAMIVDSLAGKWI